MNSGVPKGGRASGSARALACAAVVLVLAVLSAAATGAGAVAGDPISGRNDVVASTASPGPRSVTHRDPAAASGSPTSGSDSLAAHLGADGSLLPSANGSSFDPTGFRLTSGPDGSPRFVPEASPAGAPALAAGEWDDRFGRTGFDLGGVEAVAVDGEHVYVGGSFDTAAGQLPTDSYRGVAHWDGRRWQRMGTGMDDVGGVARVNAVLVNAGQVYAAGLFTEAGGVPANGIARWNGSSWSPLGSGLEGPGPLDRAVSALAVRAGRIVAGGVFQTAGGVPSQYLAEWDGSSWAPLGAGVSGPVETLAVSGANLYVGGAFAQAGSVANANGIARWNGSSWSGLGTGFGNVSGSGWVHSIAVDGSSVYAAGNFSTAGGNPAMSIARWNGSTWSPLGAGLVTVGIPNTVPGTVDVVALHDGDLFVAGNFTRAGSTDVTRLAAWNGSSWSAVPTGELNNAITSMTSTPDGLLVTGLELAGDTILKTLGYWTGTEWRVLGQGILRKGNSSHAGVGGYGDVRAVAVTSTGEVYAGGVFVQAGHAISQAIARWDGTRWHSLDGGLFLSEVFEAEVYALFVDPADNLYVGGDFATAGSVAASNLARWDGDSWSPVGAGTNGPVHSLARDGSKLYVGGKFTTAGPIAAAAMATYDLETGAWARVHPLDGLGIGDFINTFEFWGDWVFVGGYFATFGIYEMNSLMAINRVTGDYTDIGLGVNDLGRAAQVRDIEVVGNKLYVGGRFLGAGSILAEPPNHITAPSLARIDLSTEVWSLVGSPTLAGGTTPSVSALEVVGDHIYVGGNFATAGGITANNIARFDTVSETWSALGSGLEPGGINEGGKAFALWDSPSGPELLVGGEFGTAGGEPAASFTAYGLPDVPSPAPGAEFHALTPARVLDTRPGPRQTGLAGEFGPRDARVLQVTGRGGVPAGATAVMLNVTAVNPSAESFLSLVPALTPGQVPSTSSLNLTPGTVRPNLVLARLDGAGRTTIYNNSGNVHVLADVVGWYDDGTVGGDRLTALTPARILDTRPGPRQTGLAGEFGPRSARVLDVAGRGGVPAGATAVVLNVTAVNPSAEGFLSLTPQALAVGEVPPTSNLNLASGQVRPNLVVVQLNGAGDVTIYNNSGTVHVLADVVGYYSADPAGQRVQTLTPVRILDTRPTARQAGLAGEFGPRHARVLQVTGRGGVPEGATAVWMNVTSIFPSTEGFLSLTPELAPGAVPATSNLNLAAGQVVPNLVLVKLDAWGRVTIYNNSGTVHVAADVVGYVS